MKSLKILWKELAFELASWCCTSAALDYKKLESRIEHEGISFLTISLPAFGKDFEACLEREYIDSSCFVGFQRRRGPLPLFLGGFLSQVFDAVSGRLLDDPSIDCIYAIRQLTLMYGKILLECSEERTRGAIDGYIKCEKEVEEADSSISDGTLMEFRRISALLFGNVFSGLDELVGAGELVPKHGPGSTADKLFGNKKFDQRSWNQRLEDVFPFGDYALPNWRYYYQLDDVTFLEPGSEIPAKVITVPKTLKTPRIIAVEPTCMQYMQQSLLEPMVSFLESDIVPFQGRNLSSGMIGFSDQSPNRDLAQRGSADRSLATIDLSEASDRVSMLHVRHLFARWPRLLEAIEATRSQKAAVPGHGIVSLNKYASMGSALCFPVEAMVFLTVVFMGIQDGLSRPVTRSDIRRFRGQVRVYGDDIVIPADFVRPVMDNLESFGFKINKSKSFWNGKFRESCGGDYYDGEWVTPVRFRRVEPQSRADVPELISLIEFRNALYLRGLWKTCAYLDSKIGKLIRHFPIVDQDAALLGRTSFLPYEAERSCPNLHRPLVRGYAVSTIAPASPVSGEGALLKFLLKRGEEPFADSRHLERQGRPDAVNIKLRWMTPY